MHVFIICAIYQARRPELKSVLMKLLGKRGKQQLLPISPPETNLRFFESVLYDNGFEFIAGVDEAGRGCLAGPVVAASVILPEGCSIPGLNDSKQLTSKERDCFYDIIVKEAVSWSVALASPKEIDETNILRASLEAMKRAILQLSNMPSFLLVDGQQSVDLSIPQKLLIKGDARSLSVAAASVIAKVSRDRLMVQYEKEYPNFSFSIHKGYGTTLHMDEIARHGPTPIHRMSFEPLKTFS